MSSVTDPSQHIVDLLNAEWSTTTGGPAPTINKKWYSEVHPKVLETDGRTKRTRHISVKEIVASHEVFGELIETVEMNLQLDIWSESETAAEQMRDEVKRILRANANDPHADIDYVGMDSWQDMSAFDGIDNLYRFTANLTLRYEED